MNIKKKAAWAALLLFCLNSAVFAQDISMKLSNVTVKEAIETLKEKNGYSFVFVSGDIDTRKIISVNATNHTVSEVVKQILDGQQIGRAHV